MKHLLLILTVMLMCSCRLSPDPTVAKKVSLEDDSQHVIRESYCIDGVQYYMTTNGSIAPKYVVDSFGTAIVATCKENKK